MLVLSPTHHNPSFHPGFHSGNLCDLWKVTEGKNKKSESVCMDVCLPNGKRLKWAKMDEMHENVL